MLGEGGLELRGHEAGVAGRFEEVVEAGEQLVSRGCLQGEAAADAAAEGGQLGGPESMGEAPVAGEDDAEELARIEVLAGEDAQLAEDGGEGLLGLVDDEDGAEHGGGDVIRPALSQGLEPSPAVVCGEGDAEEVAELPVEVAGAALGVLDGADDDVGQAGEAVLQETERDALSESGLVRPTLEARR